MDESQDRLRRLAAVARAGISAPQFAALEASPTSGAEFLAARTSTETAENIPADGFIVR